MAKIFYKVLSKIIFIVNNFVSNRLQKYRDEDLVKSVTTYQFSFTHALDLNSNKISIRNGSSDFEVFKQIFIFKEYQPIVDLFNKHEYVPEFMIDAGANVGYSSLYLAASFSKLKIVALEPFEENFQQLVFNTKSISITPLQCAIWSKDEELTISHDFRDGKEWSKSVTRINEKEQHTDEVVRAVSLETIMRENSLQQIDFFKIDIEGAEEEFILSESFKKYIHCIKVIAVEIHDELCSRQKICDLFSANGFKWFNSGELVVAHRF